MINTKSSYKRPVFDRKRRNNSLTIPSQSLTIREILSRYTRNVAVDVKQYQPVYTDSGDVDLEKISRMDFADKREYQDSLTRDNELKLQQIRDANLKAEAEAAAAQKATHRNDADERSEAEVRTANGERGDSRKAKAKSRSSDSA